MPFQPEPGQELFIDEVTYRIAEHPNAPGIAYGQEGRQAIVYQLRKNNNGSQALKVFKPRFRTPYLVTQADFIGQFAALPGLEVCKRTVLTPSRHEELLQEHPDLIYAVLMPWIEGQTWQEILLNKQIISPQESLQLVRSFGQLLLSMEERGIAHCDLSAANLLCSLDKLKQEVALVDVEGIYAPGLPQPEAFSSGSPGYAHKTAQHGLWGTQADRFASAVLFAEMLGWSDKNNHEAAWGENYFTPDEMQENCERFILLKTSLQTNWGDRIVNLFNLAWHADTLAECPTLGEWMISLPKEILSRIFISNTEVYTHKDPISLAIQVLLEVAAQLREKHNFEGAETNLIKAKTLCSKDSGLFNEIEFLLEEISSQAALREGQKPTIKEVIGVENGISIKHQNDLRKSRVEEKRSVINRFAPVPEPIPKKDFRWQSKEDKEPELNRIPVKSIQKDSFVMLVIMIAACIFVVLLVLMAME